jgi:hypothetical protein
VFAVALLAVGGHVLAQEAAGAETFPQSREPAALAAWLQQATDIAPNQVVAVGEMTVAGVGQVRRLDRTLYRLTLRAETIEPGLYDREGFLSWYVELDLDCATRLIKRGPTTAYHHRNLQGEGQVIGGADADWTSPKPGAVIESAWRAVCDAHFQRPLAAQASLARSTAADDEGPIATAVRAPSASPRLADGQLRPSLPAPQTTRASIPTEDAARPRARTLVPPASAGGPPGRLEVQLGAFGTRQGAERASQTFKARSPEFAARLRITQAVVRGTTFFRVGVGGVADAREGRRICEQFGLAPSGCIVREAAR